MGDTSPEMDQTIAQFKEWIIATEIADLEKLHFDDHDLLRFGRARKFDLAKMQLMFTNFMNWRKAEGVDDIIDTYKYDERQAVQEHYPHGYHGVDKAGRPIYIERFGVLDVPKLFAVTTQERIIRHYIQEYELLMKLRFKACSEVKGEKIIQGLTIFDMTHGSMSTANSQTYGLCKLAAQVGSDYYPEIMGNLYIVNAPMLFSGIWAVVKGFLDEKTRNKIKILGSGFLSTLEQHIDRQSIPSFLGGGCECPGGCINSNIGPWNDFEIYGNGIRRKQAAGTQEEESKTEEVDDQAKAKAAAQEEIIEGAAAASSTAASNVEGAAASGV